MNKPLLVLDTNVVFDLLYFDDPAAQPLRRALESGSVRCVVNAATLDEFKRVLAYPHFDMDGARQSALMGRYRAWSEMEETQDGHTSLPRCGDPDDQKFLELAAACGAHGLVSKDHALLKLRRRCAPLFRILSPADAVGWIAAWPSPVSPRPAAESAVAPPR
ncbi:MAG: putative toxin-antitoxin system toxin component, PIN family [Thiobacillus sp.]